MDYKGVKQLEFTTVDRNVKKLHPIGSVWATSRKNKPLILCSDVQTCPTL